MKTVLRVAGCDLGKSSAQFVLVRVSPTGSSVESRETQAHDGRPMAVFEEWHRGGGTASLNKELIPVANPKAMDVGDEFIRGRFPGHAV